MKEIFFRVNQYLLFIILVVLFLYFGRTFIIPIVFAAMLAMLMAPVCRKLDTLGIKRFISSLACILILVAALAGAGTIVVAQFAAFSKDIECIEKEVKEIFDQGQSYIETQFGISSEKQKAIAREQAKGLSQSAGGFVTRFLGGLTTTVAGLVLTLVFTFLLLYSKEKYENFFLKLYKEGSG